MPHLDLKYSSDIEIDAIAFFEEVEATLQAHDDDTGPCKCRAYPTEIYRYSQCVVEIRMFAKRERNAQFTADLVAAIEALLVKHLSQDCSISVMLTFSPPAYITRKFHVSEKSA
ncbi:hypothetical protein Q4544_15045 [Cognatishimia sp. 1_MG-2023]|uniref:hypothetical protein n=1 Tax=Cognatishimia sp. 1_MG-2023 TaxID=3062642 RepID=UPI0026E2F9F5|nr:hypothetical protein [Cognatishimia sp. 1_MG-2023]MDO6728255.1 hypothetical protein [Cognatishimia sp. 1_MG-2023]